jgi:dephospho-CoA kinase
MHSRRMTEAEARARIAAQNPQSQKVALADVVIDTSGSYEATEAQVRQAWTRLLDRQGNPRC